MVFAMTTQQAQRLVVLVGLLLPYAVRLPRGLDWMLQYVPPDSPLTGTLLLTGFNALAWGSMLLLGRLYRHALSWCFPALPGFAYLAYQHARLDLASDPNAALALAVLPVFALVPIVLGGVVGYAFDRWWHRRQRADGVETWPPTQF